MKSENLNNIKKYIPHYEVAKAKLAYFKPNENYV